MRELAKNNDRLELKKTTELLQLKAEILAAIEQWRTSVPSEQIENELSAKLLKMAEEGTTVSQIHKLLDSLRFQSMRIRHSKITDAYAKTFDWAFEGTVMESGKPSPNRFLEWLTNKHGIYWIAGKPGSGKSTLMKYLCDHPRTRESLHFWAGNDRLVLSGYFFWSAGTDLQKTQEGLLRALLFEILRATPDVIPRVFPKRWEEQKHQALRSQRSQWTRTELLEAMDIIINEKIGNANFCFFIDGLDEYDGDHNDIVELMNRMVNCSHIKICLSSRPWNVFEDAFGQDPSQKLYLQDLTRRDIQLYVQQNLERNRRFAQLCRQDTRYEELVLEIVDKAKGVFLWVFLVVRSLLHGLTNADKITDLEKRVQRFPAELEPFFKLMLDSVEDVYQEQSAQFFLVALQAKEPLALYTYSYLDEESAGFSISAKIEPVKEEHFIMTNEEMCKRLNARCRGLLEVVRDGFADEMCFLKVDFLHRTVRDFLRTKALQDIFHSRTRGFDPVIFICKALLAQIKSVPSDRVHLSDHDHLGHLLGDLTHYAYLVELKHHIPAAEELDELEKVLSVYRRMADTFPKEIGFSASWYGRGSFLTLVVRAGLCLYVSYRLSKAHLLEDGKSSFNLRYLLQVALDPSADGNLNPKMVEVVLDAGAQPNGPLDDRVGTIWGRFLNSIYQRQRLCTVSEKKMWFDVMYTMLMHGADPEPTRFVIWCVFTSDQQAVLEDLVAQQKKEEESIGKRMRKFLGWG